MKWLPYLALGLSAVALGVALSVSERVGLVTPKIRRMEQFDIGTKGAATMRTASDDCGASIPIGITCYDGRTGLEWTTPLARPTRTCKKGQLWGYVCYDPDTELGWTEPAR